jgi:tol-pal system protein YbgF
MQLNTFFRTIIFIFACFLSTASAAGGRAVPVTEPSSAANIEQRLQNIERSLQNQGLLDMLQQLESLQREVANLRGQIELNTHELDKLKEQQRKLYMDMDNRLSRLDAQDQSTAVDTGTPPLEEMPPSGSMTTTGDQAESSLRIESVTPDTVYDPESEDIIETTADTLSEDETSDAAPADPLEAQTNYQAAFNLLKQAEYDKAIDAFDKFLVQYPDSQYSENAQYWMAEALYVTRRYNEAITEYMKLVSTYPQSQRVANSLLKIGYSYFELGQADEAKKILQDLIQKYPGTTAARDAEDRLERSPAS